MDYAYGGPIGSSINGFAAFLSGADSYFMPVSLTGVVVESTFIKRLVSTDKLDVFLQIYGSIILNVKHFQLLDENLRDILKVLTDKGLVNVLDLSQEGNELSEMLRSRLADEEALGLAQATDSNVNMVVVGSNEAKNVAVELGIRPLTYEDFLLEAYRQKLISPAEILKILL